MGGDAGTSFFGRRLLERIRTRTPLGPLAGRAVAGEVLGDRLLDSVKALLRQALHSCGLR